MRILGINHVGLAPKDPIKAKWFLNDVLGAAALGEEFVASQHTHTFMFQSFAENSAKALGRLEILVGDQSPDSPIDRFLAKKGSGIHHLAIQVDDLAAMIDHVVGHGCKMIDAKPRPGAHHTSIAFVHPESTGGLLIELVQEGPEAHA